MNFETYFTQIIQKAVKEAISEELDEIKELVTRTKKSQKRPNKSQTPTASGNIIRPKELAEMLSLSISTLYKMQSDGMLPPKIKISSHAVGWLRTDIEEWLVQRKQDV